MHGTDEQGRLVAIDPDECLRLLAAETIGRIAVVDGRAPLIFPVNYALDGETIVFRTAPGTKLRVGPGRHGCFEIDSFDRNAHTGWSVVAGGRLEEVDQYQSSTWERLRDVDVKPWAAGARDHWMRLVPSHITGRRIGAGAGVAAP
jgi:nitroimidazol reductase NimA-like FMN-containing flavoprotein (pyridoxamine 5'-phosphate oxidase superfamily)